MTSVVLVEDDADIRELTTIVLAGEGYDVRAFDSGAPALESCLLEPPDLVVLDGMLPGISGLGVLRRLRAHPATRRVPAVMVSALTSPAHVQAALHAGADAFVPKPFTRTELVDAVAEQLGTPRLPRLASA